jgi:hypothetical protein
MSWGSFAIIDFRAATDGERRGAFISLAFQPSPETAGAKVGLFQITRPRKKLQKGLWEPAYSHGGTGKTTPVNGFFIDNEGTNSPLYKMQQDESLHVSIRFLIGNSKQNIPGDENAKLGQYNTAAAVLRDQPMRGYVKDTMILQDFETVALALTDGQSSDVYAGKVLGALSWGYAVELDKTVRLLGSSVHAKARPEVKALCELWNKTQKMKIPNVNLMQCRTPPEDPAPKPFESGSLAKGKLKGPPNRVVVVRVPQK